MKNQKDKITVLNILRKAGDAGIRSIDLKHHTFGKDRSFIARIEDLRKDGYTIVTKREEIGNSWCVRYWLIENQPSNGNTQTPTQAQKKKNTPVERKVVRYEFNNETNSVKIIYA